MNNLGFISSIEVFDLTAMGDETINAYIKSGLSTITNLNNQFFLSLESTYPDICNTLDKKLLQNLNYVINQIHNKVYYFRGTFYFFYADSISKIVDAETYKFVAALAEKQASATFEELNLSIENPMFEIASRRFFDIILKIHRLSNNKIFVGLILHHDFEVISGIVYRINSFLNALYRLKIENAELDKNYDLIITDSVKSAKDVSYDHLYLLNELETTYDIEKITNTLNYIYKEKYKQ